MMQSRILFLVAFCAFAASPAECAVAGDRAYSVGQNLLVNPDFARNNGEDADGWEHFVQFGTNAVMRIVRVEGQPGVCQAAEMFFTSRDRAVQTRYKQPVPFETNTVYELEYSYQSEMDGALYADVMMTGTGPMYRSFPNIPSAKWTRVRRLFATPDRIQTIEDKIFLFQNRSMVPIRYANGSIRETDIKPEDVGRYQPSLSVHSVTGDDQLILPGGVKKTADFVIHTDCTRPDVRYEAFYINGTNGVFDVAVSNLSCHVPMDAITEGKTTLYMAMKDGDVLINWATVVIERIAESAMPKGDLLPSRPKCVVDPDGKPMVVIGMYCIDDEKSDWPMVELRRNGFNTLQSYAATGSWKNPSKIDALLERARVNKMWWMVDIPHRWAEKPGNGANLTAWFTKYDKPPATLFFYSDEMYSIRKTPMSLFDVTRKAMVSATGGRRLWIAYEGPETFLEPYLDGLLWNFSSPNMVKLARIRMGKDKILIHCFGQPHRSNLEVPVQPKEIRYEFFMPIVLGARGVFYWENSTVKWRHRHRDALKGMLFENARELNALSPLILSEEPLPRDAPKVSVKDHDGSVYVLNHILGEKGVVIIGRDKTAVGDAEYEIIPGGFKLNGVCAGPIVPGEIVITRYDR